MSAFEELNRRLPTILADCDRIASHLSLLTTSMIDEAGHAVEHQMQDENVVGNIIKQRFKDHSWPNRKDGSIATLVKTGDLKAAAIEEANRSFSMVNGIELNIQDVEKHDIDYAEYVNDGTSKMPARPFYAPLDGKDEKKVYNKATDLLAQEVIKRIRL